MDFSTALRDGLLLAALASTGCGGAVAQTAGCRDFVSCVQALDARDGETTDVARYVPGGACWGGEVGAKLCDDSCIRGLARLRASPSVPAECQP